MAEKNIDELDVLSPVLQLTDILPFDRQGTPDETGRATVQQIHDLYNGIGIEGEVNASSNPTLVLNKLNPINASGGGGTCTVPAANDGDVLLVVDAYYIAGTNNFDIDFANGNYYAAASGSDDFTTNGAFRKYRFINATIGWVRI